MQVTAISHLLSRANLIELNPTQRDSMVSILGISLIKGNGPISFGFLMRSTEGTYLISNLGAATLDDLKLANIVSPPMAL
jgi:hypothetical protein